MLSQVRGSVWITSTDKECKEPLADRRFEIRSPLLDAKAKKGVDECNLNPFWAALRGVSPKSVHNMELAMETVNIPHMSFNFLQKIPADISVRMPVLRNVAPIEKDDVLCLPLLA